MCNKSKKSCESSRNSKRLFKRKIMCKIFSLWPVSQHLDNTKYLLLCYYFQNYILERKIPLSSLAIAMRSSVGESDRWQDWSQSLPESNDACFGSIGTAWKNQNSKFVNLFWFLVCLLQTGPSSIPVRRLYILCKITLNKNN